VPRGSTRDRIERPDDLLSPCAVMVNDVDPSAPSAALVASASRVTAEVMSFIVRFGCGLIQVALPAARCTELGLPTLSYAPSQPTFAVSVDSADGVGTGISAADRSYTARLLASPDSTESDFTRPGHVIPVRVPEPCLGLPTIAEVAFGLTARSEAPGVVVSVLTEAHGNLMSVPSASKFATEHDLRFLHLSEHLQR
jgi:3,4-dihydroxy 2-butanone 4-phosphate synthase/GTP cyclohydrolase II